MGTADNQANACKDYGAEKIKKQVRRTLTPMRVLDL